MKSLLSQIVAAIQAPEPAALNFLGLTRSPPSHAARPLAEDLAGVEEGTPTRLHRGVVAVCRTALAHCLMTLTIALGVANATPTTWNFAAKVQTPSDGNSSLTGTFTLDPANANVTSFNFVTPVGNITSAAFTASVQLFTPAFDPHADFVDLFITDADADVLTLFFKTSLATFSGSTFYTKGIQLSSNFDGGSQFQCGGPGSICSNVDYTTIFVSGAATIACPSPSVPEPSGMALAGVGLIAIGVAGRRRHLSKRKCPIPKKLGTLMQLRFRS
jgi:PEP-CTERM motif